MEIMESYEAMRDRYENLILQRDRLEKEAEHYRMEYFREFGGLITDAFQAQIDCIALKKSIAFCQAKRNSGEEIDPISMQEFIDSSLLAYNAQLKDLLDLTKTGKSMVPIPVLDVQEIKRIYRRVAKRLHPDICPLTAEEPELMALFQKVLFAYRANDLKGIREAEILINRFLKKRGEDPETAVIENLPEKIEEIEAEIARIAETEPYIYKKLLEDAEAVERKRKDLTAKKENYSDYAKELRAHLESLLAE
jgi:hypothetical protein